jgi:hypothetical protein
VWRISKTGLLTQPSRLGSRLVFFGRVGFFVSEAKAYKKADALLIWLSVEQVNGQPARSLDENLRQNLPHRQSKGYVSWAKRSWRSPIVLARRSQFASRVFSPFYFYRQYSLRQSAKFRLSFS